MASIETNEAPAAVAPPEPDLTPDEMVERARALVPMLVEQQAETEERTYYSEEIHQAFTDAGFYLITHPRRYGGYEFPASVFYRVTAEISRGCTSSGWCYSLGSGHTIALAAFWEEEAQRELLGNGHFICPATLKPQGMATRVDGGWRITGTFNYCSGAPYATHYWGHAIPDAPPEDGSPLMPIQFICPRESWTLLDDWGGTLGLKGSGSHSIQIEDAFVPDHLVQTKSTFMTLAPTPGEETLGARLHGNRMYNGSAFVWFITEATALAAGCARAGLDSYADLIEARQTPIPPMIPRAEDLDYQLWYGEGAGKVAAAEGVMEHAIRMLDELAERGGPTLEDELIIARLSRETIELAFDALRKYFFRTAGSTDVRTGTRIERLWRDFSQLHSHNGFVFIGEAVSRDLARVRFGVDAPEGMRSIKAGRAPAPPAAGASA